MQIIKATGLHRKSGGAQWRELRFFRYLEVETELCRECPRRHIMRPAERRQKVIKRIFIRHIHTRKLQAPLEPIPVEKVVVPTRRIKQIPLLNARRVMVIRSSPWSRNFQQR